MIQVFSIIIIKEVTEILINRQRDRSSEVIRKNYYE